MRIYKLIYYHFILKSKKKNAVPEIPVYAMLSIVQTNNLIAVVNLVLLITKIDTEYNVLKFALFGPITFYGINHYYFSIKGNGARIIKDQTYSLGKYSFLLDVYNITSIILVAVTYYFYKNF